VHPLVQPKPVLLPRRMCHLSFEYYFQRCHQRLRLPQRILHGLFRSLPATGPQAGQLPRRTILRQQCWMHALCGSLQDLSLGNSVHRLRHCWILGQFPGSLRGCLRRRDCGGHRGLRHGQCHLCWLRELQGSGRICVQWAAFGLQIDCSHSRSCETGHKFDSCSCEACQ